MNYLNYEFFDEFKRLDNICNDIYGKSSDNKLGVTLYLEDMNKKAYQGNHKIPNWSFDYNRLKETRNIRNELAHSQNSFSYKLCTQEDIDFIRSFHSRIINQTDPLSLLYKQLHSQKTISTKPQVRPQIQHNSHNNTPIKKPSGCITAIASFAIIVACIIAFLI